MFLAKPTGPKEFVFMKVCACACVSGHVPMCVSKYLPG